MGGRVRAAVGVLAVLAACGALAWMLVGRDPTVTTMPDIETSPLWSGGSSTTEIDAMAAGAPASFSSAAVLNTTEQPIIVRSLEVVDLDTTVEVLGLGVRLSESGIAGTARSFPLPGLIDPAGFEIPPGENMRIVVGLASREGSAGGVHGFRVRYEFDGRLYESILDHHYVVKP